MIKLTRYFVKNSVAVAFVAIFTTALSAAEKPHSKKATTKNAAKTTESDAASKDADITNRIRQSVANDLTLSPEAHNVKIETTNGAVTLKGPVRNIGEKSIVIALAGAVAGQANVKSELEVMK